MASSVSRHRTAGAPFLSLKKAMRDSLIESTEFALIRDEFRKAKHHFLILPKLKEYQDTLNAGVSALTREHIALVEKMVSVAEEFMEKEVAPGVPFNTGFHSIPSMTPFHMHVISIDFDSPCLKNKKHWNSFTSEFFIHSWDVIEKLKSSGRVLVDKNKCQLLIKQPLVCPWCGGITLKNMPQLKDHLATLEHKRKLKTA